MEHGASRLIATPSTRTMNICMYLGDRERAWNLDLAIASFISYCLLRALPEAWSGTGVAHAAADGGVLEACARPAGES